MNKNYQNSQVTYLKYLELDEAGDSISARHFLESAVYQGNDMAMHALAYELYNNEENVDEALKLYRKAAKNGLTVSMLNLARHYEKISNLKQYFFWLKKAAILGDEQAIKEILNPFPFNKELRKRHKN